MMFGGAEISCGRYEKLIAREAILKQVVRYLDSVEVYPDMGVLKAITDGAFEEKPEQPVPQLDFKAINEQMQKVEAQEATSC